MRALADVPAHQRPIRPAASSPPSSASMQRGRSRSMKISGGDDDDGVTRDLDHFAFDSDSESDDDDDVADLSDETACTDCECIEWLHREDGQARGQHTARPKVCLSSLAPLSFCRRPSATNGSPVLGPTKPHHRLSLPRTSGSPIRSLAPNFTKHQRASTGGAGGSSGGKGFMNRPHHSRRQSDGIIWSRWHQGKDSSSGDEDKRASLTLSPRLGRSASSASLAKINVEGQMSPTHSRAPSFSAGPGRARSHSDPRAMLVQLTPLRAAS